MQLGWSASAGWVATWRPAAPAGHEVVGYDPNPQVTDVADLAELVEPPCNAPRVGLGDGAGGRSPSRPSTRWPTCSMRATSSSTAATPSSPTTGPRAERLAPKGIGYIDCGVSGGVWGKDNGYA